MIVHVKWTVVMSVCLRRTRSRSQQLPQSPTEWNENRGQLLNRYQLKLLPSVIVRPEPRMKNEGCGQANRDYALALDGHMSILSLKQMMYET